MAEIAALPPLEAIAALAERGKRLDPSFSWQDAWQADHAAMYTVAKSAGFDVLTDLFDATMQMLAEGKTQREVSRELIPILQGKGWWGRQPAYDPLSGEMRWSQLGSTRRLQTIFSANMRVSYAAGHWSRFERTKAARPYLRYVCILDDATRPAHRARHNLVLPVDHPYWDTWAPPCGWGCRCTLQSLSEREVKRLQSQGEALFFEPPPDTYRNFVNRRTGEISRVPDGIDPGWAYNPGKAGWTQVVRAAEAKMAGGLFGAGGLPRIWPKPPATAEEAEQLMDEISQGQAAWAKSLGEDERQAIASYKSAGYRDMNGVLRGDERVLDDMDDDDRTVADDAITDMSAALDRAAMPKAITVFRGMPAEDADDFEAAEIGELRADPAFLSASLLESIGQKFGEYLIEIRVLAGQRGAALIHSIPDVDHVEYEVVLAPGTRLRVVGKSKGRLIVEVLGRDGS